MCEEEPTKKVETPEPFFELPRFIRRLSWKHLEILGAYERSIAFWSAAAFVYTIYLCDWKVIVAYLPYYNGKFDEKKD